MTQYSVSTLDVGEVVGDEAFGFVLTLPVDPGGSPGDPGAQFETHVVITRLGDFATWIVYGGVPADRLPIEQSVEFARLATNKLEASEGS